VVSPGYFSIISSLLPSKPSQTAPTQLSQLTALLKANGFQRGTARPFFLIFGGLGRRGSEEWKERRREEKER